MTLDLSESGAPHDLVEAECEGCSKHWLILCTPLTVLQSNQFWPRCTFPGKTLFAGKQHFEGPLYSRQGAGPVEKLWKEAQGPCLRVSHKGERRRRRETTLQKTMRLTVSNDVRSGETKVHHQNSQIANEERNKTIKVRLFRPSPGVPRTLYSLVPGPGGCKLLSIVVPRPQDHIDSPEMFLNVSSRAYLGPAGI